MRRTRSGSAILVDLDDLAVDDGQGHDGERPPGQGDHRSGVPFTSAGYSRAQRGARASLATAWTPRMTAGGPAGAEVSAQHDVWVEHPYQCVEVTGPSRCEDGVDHPESAITPPAHSSATGRARAHGRRGRC